MFQKLESGKQPDQFSFTPSAQLNLLVLISYKAFSNTNFGRF